MKKVLVITSVASMVDQFFMPNLQLLQDMGYQVHVACNFQTGSTCSNERIEALKQTLSKMDIAYYHIDFARNVLSLRKNALAYKQVKKLLAANRYDMVHCHSPIGGLVTRLAGRKYRKTGTKMLYTAHGFHFYKGAPLKNWLLYYPAEKFCSRFTDVLITINQEDYALAQQKMKAQHVVYIPGVGIDLSRFEKVPEAGLQKRQELGIPETATLLLSVGELNQNKNHETVIRAIADLDVYYIVAGKGELQTTLQQLIESHDLSDRVKLLGFRNDVQQLYQAADVFVFPSFREGLSVALMEAMASGLPVVCSNIRGNTDLIDRNGGVLFDPSSHSDCCMAIQTCIAMQEAGNYNMKKIQPFGTAAVMAALKALYSQLA